MEQIRQAIIEGASGEEIAALELPESYRAAVVLKDEVGMFEGMDSNEKDTRKSLRQIARELHNALLYFMGFF